MGLATTRLMGRDATMCGMRCLLSLGAGLILAMTSVVVAAEPVAELKPIHVEALVDGRSRLIFHRNTVWWYHMEWTCPGRLGEKGTDRPTVINEDGWMPKWPDRNGPKNEFGFCESSRYEKLDPPLPARGAEVQRAGYPGSW